MARIVWDNIDARPYELGVDRGIINVAGKTVTPWNGLISIDESEVSQSTVLSSFDGVTYANFEFGGVYQAEIKAYGFPTYLSEVLGLSEVFSGLSLTAQPRVPFDFSYRTLVGESDYKIHIVHDATIAPSKRSSTTITDKVDVETYSWSVSTRPPNATTFKPTSHIIIDTVNASPADVTAVEDKLYGTVSLSPDFPTQAEVIAIFAP
jgi:hypothetical protein